MEKSRKKGLSRACPPVTAVVINRNGREYIQECLESVRASLFPLARVIFVDDASGDGSADWVRSNFPEVELIRMERRRGPGAARNRGIERARTRLVLLLDCDGRLTPDCLERLVGSMRAHPEAVLCAPRVMAGQAAVVQHDGGHCHFLGLMTLDNAWMPVSGDPRSSASEGVAQPIESAGSTALLIDKEKALAPGLFDEEMGIYCDDLDFTARLCACGLRLFFVPGAVVLHGKKNLGRQDYSAVKMFQQTRNRRLFALKLLDWRTLLLTSPLHLTYECLALGLAVREGLVSRYLAGWGSFLLHLPDILRKRKILRRLRRLPDKGFLRAGPLTLHPGVADAGIAAFMERGMERLCGIWWRTISPLLRSTVPD